METTTDVVHRKDSYTAERAESFWKFYRRHGYFFREAAILTILTGFGMHLYRVIFGDDLTLQYVVTPMSDMLLMIPMTYAAITGILSYRRMVFVNCVHKIALTASLVYITMSVPLHFYVAFVLGDVSVYVHMFGYWFSWLLICAVYPPFVTMLCKVKYRN
ncbi:MAG: hypothetical protein QOD39_3871 [Mycobacterium sp.]|jgi:hypothetical protein|nr:hypothetical protein [Mycobacterium sp.]